MGVYSQLARGARCINDCPGGCLVQTQRRTRENGWFEGLKLREFLLATSFMALDDKEAREALLEGRKKIRKLYSNQLSTLSVNSWYTNSKLLVHYQ